MHALSDELSDFARAIVLGRELPHGSLVAGPNYSVATAIGVYRNNYRGNLHDALAGAYPVVEQLVGREFFRRLTREFIERQPSHSGNLHHYGAEMAAFIAAFEAAQELAYLADVAALEWACHCAYFADDAATLDIAKLAQILPEQYPGLVLITHPACHVLRSRYPVAAIWHAHQPGAPGDFHIDLDSGACCVLIIRQDDAVQVSELNEADAGWLSNIRDGSTLGAATAATLERYPDFDLQAGLANLVLRGVFAGFDARKLR